MAATTSMQQHYGLQQTPLRTLNRGNHFLRSSRNAVSVKRKSAVELLQETKSLYVKSETVLDRKQELKSSSCLYSTIPPPQSFASGGGRYKENKGACLDGRDCQMPMPPPKSPRLVNLPQRRSTTPAPPAHSDQLQNKLRRLLNADSKENLLDDGVQESIQLPVRSFSRCSSRGEERISSSQSHCPVHHKSLPDLHTSISSSSETSDQSDPPSYEYTTYNTGSEKSISKSKSGDAMSLASSHSRQLSLHSSSTEDSEDDSSFSSDDHQSTGAHSSAFMIVGSPVKSSASYGGSTSGTDNRYNESDWNTSGKTEESYNWRPILRSKSDVGRRYARLSSRAEMQSPNTPPDLETFFEQLGLNSVDYNLLIKDDKSTSSSPVFFSDTSTVDSTTLCTVAGENASDAAIAPSSSDLPSIVERNARIIKWLCNCRKAQVQSSPTSNIRHTTLS